MSKKLLTIVMSVFSFAAMANNVSPACPIDDEALIQAVNQGQKISCYIEFFYAGRLRTLPNEPVAKSSIEAACEAAIDGCGGMTLCMASDYLYCNIAN